MGLPSKPVTVPSMVVIWAIEETADKTSTAIVAAKLRSFMETSN
jgi:hypothetical protein